MEERLERQRQEIENMKNAKAKAETLLASLAEETSKSGDLEDKSKVNDDDPQNVQRSESITLWRTLRDELAS